MKKINLPLLLGCCILVVLILMMIFPQMITDISPYSTKNIRAWHYEKGELELEAPPYPPSKESPLGSDEMGRDLLSFIVYGTRLTLTLSLFVVLGRFFVALAIGIPAGFGSAIAKTIIAQFTTVFSALPALLIAVIVLEMNFFSNLYKEQSMIAFVIVLTFIGWGKLGHIIMERVHEILAKPFIKGETAIGKSPLKIALENVVPHLAPELVVLFFMEISRALTMIMQLGVFGIFIGNMGFILDDQGGKIEFMDISFEPEWASMMGSAKDFIRTAPWTVFYPSIAFFMSILGFNLLGEGLRKMLQERNSNFLRDIRGLFYFKMNRWIFSMKGTEAKNFQYKIRMAFLSISLLVIGSSLYGSFHDGFNYKNASSNFDFDDKEVIIGTDQAKDMANNIANVFKQLGLKPLNEKGFIREYETKDIYIPNFSQFCVVSHDGETKEFEHGKDYVFLSFGDWEGTGRLYNATEEDLLAPKDFSRFDDQFVLIDSALYSEKAFNYITQRIMTASKAKGILKIIPKGKKLPHEIGKNIYDGVILGVTPKTGKALVGYTQQKLHIGLKSKHLENIGRNIIGMIPGNDPSVGKEAIIFGMGYNYDAKNKEIAHKKILFSFELAKKLLQQKKNRTIIFAFWDGTMSDTYNGLKSYCEDPLYDEGQSVLYIDLTKINDQDVLYYNAEQAPVSRYFAYRFRHELEKNLDKRKIQKQVYDLDMHMDKKEEQYMDKIMYLESNIPTIILGMKKNGRKYQENATLNKLGEILIESIENIND